MIGNCICMHAQIEAGEKIMCREDEDDDDDDDPFFLENKSPTRGIIGFFFFFFIISFFFLPNTNPIFSSSSNFSTSPSLGDAARPTMAAAASASARASFDMLRWSSAFREATATSVSDSLSLSNFSSALVSCSSVSSFFTVSSSWTGGVAGAKNGTSCLGKAKACLGEYISPAKNRSPNIATASFTERNGREVSTAVAGVWSRSVVAAAIWKWIAIMNWKE